MPRHTITNHGDLSRIIGTCFTNAENTPHRQLIILEGPPEGWLKHFALKHNIACISADTRSDQSDQVTSLLGSEHDILAHELSDPMDASLLAALAGTVTYSGALILSLPIALNDDGPLVVDTCEAKSHRVTNRQKLNTSRFVHRFVRQLKSAIDFHPEHIVIANYQADNPLVDKLEIESQIIPFRPPHNRCPPNAVSALAETEQDSLLQQACAQLSQHQSVCISIVGKRGRGKSALTARIANWLHKKEIPYCITALHGSALSTFHRMTDHASDECFLPVQKLQTSTVDTLLVDEASTISLTLLKALLKRHRRLILCTTVEGYESSGRAFELRLQRPIKQHFDSQLLLSPKQPWRWIADDPVETFIDSLVLNEPRKLSQQTSHLRLSGAEAISQDNVNIRKITQQQLLNNEQDLRNVFGLLRDTHYQTSVKDLQHLLDGKNILLWVLEDKQTMTILGVLLLTLELAIEPSLHQAIVCKQRRLPHHLLAQLLAQSANMTQTLDCCFARVVRISIASNLRRQGFGSYLLMHVENELFNGRSTMHAVDAMGASFTNDSTSVAFWRSNGYSTFHQGYRKNPRTGENAEAVLKSHHATIEKSLQTAVQILEDNQQSRLCQTNSQSAELNPPTLFDRTLLKQFAKGYRSVHDTYAALSRLSLCYPLTLQMNEQQSRKQFESQLRNQVALILNHSC